MVLLAPSHLYTKAKGGDIIAQIFYLKARGPVFRDRLNIDLEAIERELGERLKGFVRGRMLPASVAVGPPERKLLYWTPRKALRPIKRTLLKSQLTQAEISLKIASYCNRSRISTPL